MGAVKRRALTLVEVFGGEACGPEGSPPREVLDLEAEIERLRAELESMTNQRDSWRKAAGSNCDRWKEAVEEREAQRRRAEAAEDELSFFHRSRP